jgi:6-phosphogluconate dehydrogenase
MEIGLVGLGKMGGNMAERLIRAGHSVFGFARDEAKVSELSERGGTGVSSLDELVQRLSPQRKIWLMIPAGKPVQDTIDHIAPLLDTGDVVIDGGNSHYGDSIRRADELKKSGIHFVDVGISGGIWGLEEGYCMMVGGDEKTIDSLRPIFEALAPGPNLGWGRVGPLGSGHFVKMVHNGIEYGLMEAYAEGFAILQAKEEFRLDLAQIAEIWKHGSVIRSWLLDLTKRALSENPNLEGIAPYVEDSGEGRWTVSEAIDLDVAAPIINLSLIQRLRSRDEEGFSDRLLSAMRNKFGGHEIRKK